MFQVEHQRDPSASIRLCRPHRPKATSAIQYSLATDLHRHPKANAQVFYILSALHSFPYASSRLRADSLRTSSYWLVQHARVH